MTDERPEIRTRQDLVKAVLVLLVVVLGILAIAAVSYAILQMP